MRSKRTDRYVAALLLVLLAASAGAQGNVRYHGFDFDAKHRIIVEEENGTARLCLVERMRAPGGPELVVTEEEEDPTVRYVGKEVMATITSEVAIPAAPNYFKNRGAKYRITIEGGTVGTGYARRFDVVASEARNRVMEEIQTLAAQTLGVRRDALYFATLIALRILNESRHFPAELSLTLLRSKVGQVRLTEEGTMERQSLELGPDPEAETPSPEEFAEGYERESHRLPPEGYGSALTFREPPVIRTDSGWNPEPGSLDAATE